ncbi:chemotaxis protein CheX [Bdellovibrio reynosensis]|uniref:Chemotaxis protein CheX n=1 Tax=Bdellovibrio reynosensis TaxID=2835041 RepID=A0ABY4C5G7_9BACT|nr:chemotaxis protein CheX [Bdellovibrio reynosensis]UOF00187.1 chemotaxis protein CheX [Bdellovibrio reynosensis]
MAKLKVLQKSGACILIPLEDLNRSDSAELKNVLAGLTAEPAFRAFVIDFENTPNIHEAPLADLVVASKALKSHDIPTYGINMDKRLVSRIRASGLDTAILNREAKDIPELANSVVKPIKFDTEIINPFVHGALETLKLQASINCRSMPIYLKGKGPTIDTEIAAVLSIVSGKFDGTFALRFPKQLFLSIVEQMLGEKYEDICDDNADAAGELLNIIFGVAKEQLNQKNYQIQQALPTVIYGERIKVKSQSSEPVLIIPIETDFGVFHIEIGVDPSAAENKKAS